MVHLYDLTEENLNNQNETITKMHSSRMRAARLLTIHEGLPSRGVVCLQMEGEGGGGGFYLPHGIVGRQTP